MKTSRRYKKLLAAGAWYRKAAKAIADKKLIVGSAVLNAGGRPGDVPKFMAADPKGNGAVSNATTVNPKDLFGKKKLSFTKVSAIAMAHCSMAMMDGARKYGPYNWRAKPVIASIYIDAALRHIFAWFEGEELAEDSDAHHLGHAMACCAILLDAQAHGVLIDDRPNGKAVFSKVLNDLSALIQKKNDEHQVGKARELAFGYQGTVGAPPMKATVQRLKRKQRLKAKKGVR